MDSDEIDRILEKNIPKSMLQRGRTTVDSLLGPVRDVLNRRHFPDKALTDLQLEIMLQLLSSLDTDKDPEAARVGEREARIASPFIGHLSAGFNHGVGRSGHLVAPQPKAPGAFFMQQVANNVALDAIQKLGLSNMKSGIVTPLSTGMSISLILGALRREHGIKHVLSPRIDHLSPHRAIAFAGLEEIVIPTVINEDAVQADLGNLEKHIKNTKSCAVLATTTFFPPRESDPVKEIARLCAENTTPLVINNAYGVQSEKTMEVIRSASDAGRVDAVVQSSDKNFLAPVGASVIVSPSKTFVEQIAETYAGRASAAPIVQTLAALLAIGFDKYKELQKQQIENLVLLRSKMHELADEFGQRVLSVWNPVACAVTVDGVDAKDLGARLYSARVTGPRAIEKGGPGSSCDGYPHSYLVMNAAIGASRDDVEKATFKLAAEWRQLQPK